MNQTPLSRGLVRSSDNDADGTTISLSPHRNSPSTPPTDRNAEQSPKVDGNPSSPLPDASNGFPVDLNDRWRVSFDPLQWILQRRRGSQWRDRSFCVTREGLLRCIREYCSEVETANLELISALPEWHPDRSRGDR